ncbi:MAG: hypothetical protein QW579_05745 [Desulfurococcaceae archaeon]
MRRRIRAITPVIATAILVTIALAIWYYSTRYVSVDEPVAEARAILTSNALIGVNQVVGVNLMIESRTDAPLYVRTIRMISDAGGTLRTHSLSVETAVNPSWPINFTGTPAVGVGIFGEGIVRPHSTLTISMILNFGTNYVTMLRFEIELVDPGGRAYWISTNEIRP